MHLVISTYTTLAYFKRNSTILEIDLEVEFKVPDHMSISIGGGLKTQKQLKQ